MRINTKEFCLEFRLLVVVIVLCDKTVIATGQPCKATHENECVVVCHDWDFDVAGLKHILEAEGKKNETCGLVFESCTLETAKLWEGLNPNPKIDNLKIVDSPIDINKLHLQIFPNVHELTVKNTTTATLQGELFQKLPNLRRLQLQSNKFLRKVEKGLLQNLTLDYLQVRELEINPTEIFEFFQNLTAILAPFSNLKVLVLTNCSVFGFEDGLFNHSWRVCFDGDEIQTLPERIFQQVEQLSLPKNPLICDYDMEWMRGGDCAVEDVEVCPQIESLVVRKFSNESLERFTITNDNPECLEVNIPEDTNLDRAFLWYGNYENTTFPHFKCLKIPHRKLKINVKPNVNYLVCLATGKNNFQIDITGCLPIKTRPHHEDQPWLTKKSIPISIISISVVFLFALATGALIIYLSVRKNPSLIRGSKRVIEVKRHDKAQILIMPRGYEPVSQEGSPLALPNPRFSLEPSTSYDTISTVSYVSANQPTQLEILSYRFNRLRELFQRSSVPSFFFSNQVLTPVNQRLPPNVDLLLEYEWYTITTTTTTQV